jgi:hypothetical protein
MANPNQMLSMCQGKKLLPLQSERQLRLLETFATEKMNDTPSLVNRHRFAVDPDTYFHFDAHPDPDWHHSNAELLADSTPIFTHPGKQTKKNSHSFTAMPVYNVFLFHKWQRCHVVKYIFGPEKRHKKNMCLELPAIRICRIRRNDGDTTIFISWS